jgi:hypothetical protein
MCVCGDMILKESKNKVLYGFGRVWYCLTYFQCGYLGSGKWRFETVGNGKEIRIKGSYVSKGWREYGIRITLCILIVHHFFFVYL